MLRRKTAETNRGDLKSQLRLASYVALKIWVPTAGTIICTL